MVARVKTHDLNTLSFGYSSRVTVRCPVMPHLPYCASSNLTSYRTAAEFFCLQPGSEPRMMGSPRLMQYISRRKTVVDCFLL